MTSSAIGLLMLALSLLTAVRDNPQLPPEFKAQATTLAITAISTANAELAKPQPVVMGTTTSVIDTPVVGTTVPMAEDSTPKAETPTTYPNGCPFPSLEGRQIIQDGEKHRDAITGLLVDPATMKCL